MKKKWTKVVSGLALTAAIGAGAIGANSFLTSLALAADVKEGTPVITTDTKETGENTEDLLENTNVWQSDNPDIVIKTDDNGNQTIVFDESLTEEEKLQLEKDLERAQIDRNGGADESETTPVFVEGTPSTDDLTKEEAIQIATKAIIEDYALTNETLSKFSIHTAFNVVDPKNPVWSITFYPTNQSDFAQIGNYNLTIDSLSGEVITILSAADGVG